MIIWDLINQVDSGLQKSRLEAIEKGDFDFLGGLKTVLKADVERMLARDLEIEGRRRSQD